MEMPSCSCNASATQNVLQEPANVEMEMSSCSHSSSNLKAQNVCEKFVNVVEEMQSFGHTSIGVSVLNVSNSSFNESIQMPSCSRNLGSIRHNETQIASSLKAQNVSQNPVNAVKKIPCTCRFLRSPEAQYDTQESANSAKEWSSSSTMSSKCSNVTQVSFNDATAISSVTGKLNPRNSTQRSKNSLRFTESVHAPDAHIYVDFGTPNQVEIPIITIPGGYGERSNAVSVISFGEDGLPIKSSTKQTNAGSKSLAETLHLSEEDLPNIKVVTERPTSKVQTDTTLSEPYVHLLKPASASTYAGDTIATVVADPSNTQVPSDFFVFILDVIHDNPVPVVIKQLIIPEAEHSSKIDGQSSKIEHFKWLLKSKLYELEELSKGVESAKIHAAKQRIPFHSS